MKRTTKKTLQYTVTPKQVASLFDKSKGGNPDRDKAIFLTYMTAGYWYIEIQTIPGGPWGSLLFFVSVIDPASLMIDPRRCHEFHSYELVEAYIRTLRIDKGGEPPSLGGLKLVRREIRK